MQCRPCLHLRAALAPVLRTLPACSADLPVPLRGEIVSRLAGPALARSHVLRRLDEGVRGQLASAAVPVRLVAGHNLYEEGDDSRSFFFLQEGAPLSSSSRLWQAGLCGSYKEHICYGSWKGGRTPVWDAEAVGCTSLRGASERCLASLVGEALAIGGAHVTAMFKSPALVGQAAIFASEVDACRTRLHTGAGGLPCGLACMQDPNIYIQRLHLPPPLVQKCEASRTARCGSSSPRTWPRSQSTAPT